MSVLHTLIELAKRTLLPSGGTTERAIKSGVWAVLTNVLARSLYFGRLLVLAALLVPADFGLMGIATLTLGAVDRFTELGVDQALIQRTEANVDRYLDTVWTAKLARGLLIAVGLYIAAPLIGTFFSEMRAVPLLRVIGFVPLIQGLANPAIVYFEKDLRFHKRLVLQVSAALAETCIAVAVALVYRSVWALVIGAIVGEMARLLVSYVIHRYRPSIAFDRDLAGDLFGYGKWITGLSGLVFLTNSGDDVFLGWLLGAGALGLYQFAYQVSNAPATEVSKLISSVVFPAYAAIQNDIERLRDGYFKTLQLTAFLSFPIAAGIVVVTRPFVSAFLGTQWLPAVTAIQILAIWGLLRSLGSTTGPLFQAVGRPDLSTKIQFGKAVIIAVSIWPATARFGIEGAAAVIVGNSLLFSEPLVYYLAMRTIEGSYRRLAHVLFSPAIASVLMAGCVLAVRQAMVSSPVIEFIVSVGVGVCVYGALLAVCERRLDYGIGTVFRTITNAVRS